MSGSRWKPNVHFPLRGTWLAPFGVHAPGLRRKQAGGVALEYVLVTTFALATTLAAIGYLGKTLKSRFEELEATSIRTPSGESIWDP